MKKKILLNKTYEDFKIKISYKLKKLKNELMKR